MKNRMFRKGLSFGIVLILVFVVFAGIPVNGNSEKITEEDNEKIENQDTDLISGKVMKKFNGINSSNFPNKYLLGGIYGRR